MLEKLDCKYTVSMGHDNYVFVILCVLKRAKERYFLFVYKCFVCNSMVRNVQNLIIFFKNGRGVLLIFVIS